MLALESVSKTFEIPGRGVVTALDDVCLEIASGEFVVVVGANGAGKSTMFQVICGRERVSAGRVYLAGSDVTRWPAYRRASLVTLISQSRGEGLPRAMTVLEVMRLAGEVRRGWVGGRGRELIAEALEGLEPGLARVMDTQIWYLSGGEYQFVALAVAELLCAGGNEGHMLLLDEHVSQLAPAARERVMRATVEMIEKRGLTALLATHSPTIAASVGNRQLILGEGKVVRDLRKEQCVRDPESLRRMVIDIASGTVDC